MSANRNTPSSTPPPPSSTIIVTKQVKYDDRKPRGNRRNLDLVRVEVVRLRPSK